MRRRRTGTSEGFTTRPRDTTSSGPQAALPDPLLQVRVLEPELALLHREYQHVGAGPGLQGSQLRGAADGLRRGQGGLLHHLGQGHAQQQELGHGGGQVEHHLLDVVAVQVGADGVGVEGMLERLQRGIPAEAAGTVADVEHHATLPRRPGLGPQRAAGRVEDAVAAAGKAVGDDVARAQPPQHLAGVALHADVHHHARAALGRGAQAQLHRLDVVPTGHYARAELHPQRDVAVLQDRRRGLPRAGVTQVEQLAEGRGGDTEAADVDEGQNAHGRAVDGGAAELGEVDAAAGAGVDRGGDPAAQRGAWVDTVQTALVVVAVQVHEAGTHVAAAAVHHRGRALLLHQAAADHHAGDAVAGHHHVGSAIDVGGRVDDVTVPQQQGGLAQRFHVRRACQRRRRHASHGAGYAAALRMSRHGHEAQGRSTSSLRQYARPLRDAGDHETEAPGSSAGHDFGPAARIRL